MAMPTSKRNKSFTLVIIEIMKIKVIRLGVAMVLVMLISVAAWAQSGGEVPVSLSDPTKRGKLKAHLNSGSITIKGTARKDILVKYAPGKREDNDDDDNDNDNDNDDDNKDRKSDRNGLKKISSGTLDLEISENSNFVKVSSDSWNTRMNLTIEVPSGIDLQVHTYNDGDLEISNIQGEVELTNYNGEITATNISGSVVATTYNGEIKVTFDKVSDGTPMSFVTYNGDIDLTLPSTFKGSLKMKTQNGEILSGFDMTVGKPTPVETKTTSKGTKIVIDEWVKGDINGGGPEFIMKNYNGDILLRKK
jgi:hypothetical protein